jgi:hypothetical protein
VGSRSAGSSSDGADHVRYGLLVPGVALVLLGGVWILQGLGSLKGSFMTGQPFWAWMGAVAALVGLPLIVRGARRS